MYVEESIAHPVSAPAEVFHRSCFAMNTRFSMVLVGVDSETAEAIAAGVESDLRAYERLMSRFDSQSPLSEINLHAAEVAVNPPDQLWNILSLCRTYWQRTAGAFDITLWPLIQLWRDHLSRNRKASPEALDQASLQTGFNRVTMDETARTVRFQTAGMSLDLGGFGKGFALERIASSLRTQGVERAFLSFGESSITVLGSHPNGPAWPVGIANIFQPAETLHTFQLRDASLSTSGTAPYNGMGGTRAFGQIPAFGQTIDPRSGRPIEGYRTLSVASPSGTEAEVLSTALLVTPEPERAAVLSGFSSVSAVEIVYDSSAAGFVPRIEWLYGF